MAVKAQTMVRRCMLGAVAFAVVGLAAAGLITRAHAHKAPHTNEQLEAFRMVFMESVKKGDLLFHGDPDMQKQMGVKLSSTGMACAMCHPMASDTHPHEFPKFQEQMNQFATLRDMINWCIEKPNQGEKIDPESEAMKDLEAFIYWSNTGSVLRPGTH